MLVCRRDLLRALCAGLSGAAIAALASSVDAKPRRKAKVVWTDVVLPEDKHKARRERILRSILTGESKSAEWGDVEGGVVEASVKVVEFTTALRKDVVRVTCTAVGKLRNGPAARTHFSFGGHPSEKENLEKMMLTLIGRGVVSRLAAIARGRAKKK